MSNEKLLDIANDGILLAIESIMQRWHLGRSNDTEALESISELLKSVGLLSFFDKEKEGESKKTEVSGSLPMYDVEELNEIIKLFNNREIDLYTCICRVWNKAYLIGAIEEVKAGRLGNNH